MRKARHAEVEHDRVLISAIQRAGPKRLGEALLARIGERTHSFICSEFHERFENLPTVISDLLMLDDERDSRLDKARSLRRHTERLGLITHDPALDESLGHGATPVRSTHTETSSPIA